MSSVVTKTSVLNTKWDTTQLTKEECRLLQMCLFYLGCLWSNSPEGNRKVREARFNEYLFVDMDGVITYCAKDEKSYFDENRRSRRSEHDIREIIRKVGDSAWEKYGKPLARKADVGSVPSEDLYKVYRLDKLDYLQVDEAGFDPSKDLREQLFPVPMDKDVPSRLMARCILDITKDTELTSEIMEQMLRKLKEAGKC